MIGFDIEHISRIKNEERLLKKIATENEKAYIEKFKNKKEKVVTLWAFKEAVFKALNVKKEKISYKDIELSHLENGKPVALLHNEASVLLNGKTIEISLTHTKDIVGAVAIIFNDVKE